MSFLPRSIPGTFHRIPLLNLISSHDLHEIIQPIPIDQPLLNSPTFLVLMLPPLPFSAFPTPFPPFALKDHDSSSASSPDPAPINTLLPSTPLPFQPYPTNLQRIEQTGPNNASSVPIPAPHPTPIHSFQPPNSHTPPPTHPTPPPPLPSYNHLQLLLSLAVLSPISPSDSSSQSSGTPLRN